MDKPHLNLFLGDITTLAADTGDPSSGSPKENAPCILNPSTHVLIDWTLANFAKLERRDRMP